MWNIGDPLVQMVISMCAIGLIAANGVNGAIGNIGCWWSINANGNFLASMNPVESLISMFNGACEMWHIAIQWCHWFQWCHWYHWNHCHHWRYCCQWYLPLCDQCIIIVSNATPLLLLAPILPLPPLFTIGAINFSWMFETLHCHEMALMEPFKWHHWSNGDHHWLQWRLSLGPLAMRCTIGAIRSITIGANGSPLAPIFVAIGAECFHRS